MPLVLVLWLLLPSAECHGSNEILIFQQFSAIGRLRQKGRKGLPSGLLEVAGGRGQRDTETKRIPFLRYFSVFNLSHCENIPAPSQETFLSPEPASTPIEAAEAIVANMPNRPEIKNGLDRAFYQPAFDFVGMPAFEQFKSGAESYSVLFHELTHSTGHESRLNRKGVSRSEGTLAAFGSDHYAR